MTHHKSTQKTNTNMKVNYLKKKVQQSYKWIQKSNSHDVSNSTKKIWIPKGLYELLKNVSEQKGPNQLWVLKSFV